jgi:hypothetical protein
VRTLAVEVQVALAAVSLAVLLEMAVAAALQTV